MSARLAAYLTLVWGNALLGCFVLDGWIAWQAWWVALLSLMASLSLVALTTTDPGRTSERPDAGVLIHATSSAEERTARGTEPSAQYFTQVCSLCNRCKPERAHHCRICNRCVRKMDHHCHWVRRCVGAGNYKPYLLTLLYACLSSGTMLVILWRQAGQGLHAASQGWTAWAGMLGIIADGCALAFVFCSVSYLLIWHGYLVTKNVTTIEYFKWKRSMRDLGQCALAPGSSVRLSEYDRGLLANLREALGDQVWLWWWPALGERCHRRTVCRGSATSGDVGAPNSSGWVFGAAEAKNFLFSRGLSQSSSVPAHEDGDGDVNGEGEGDDSTLELSGSIRSGEPTLVAPL